MKIPYEPIGNTLLVEAVALSSTITIPGGISGSGKYTIRALGDGDKIPKQLKAGDIVILSDMGMMPIHNTNFHIVNAESVLAKVV